jgi:hypothetical protein
LDGTVPEDDEMHLSKHGRFDGNFPVIDNARPGSITIVGLILSDSTVEFERTRETNQWSRSLLSTVGRLKVSDILGIFLDLHNGRICMEVHNFINNLMTAQMICQN